MARVVKLELLDAKGKIVFSKSFDTVEVKEDGKKTFLTMSADTATYTASTEKVGLELVTVWEAIVKGQESTPVRFLFKDMPTLNKEAADTVQGKWNPTSSTLGTARLYFSPQANAKGKFEKTADKTGKVINEGFEKAKETLGKINPFKKKPGAATAGASFKAENIRSLVLLSPGRNTLDSVLEKHTFGSGLVVQTAPANKTLGTLGTYALEQSPFRMVIKEPVKGEEGLVLELLENGKVVVTATIPNQRGNFVAWTVQGAKGTRYEKVHTLELKLQE